MSTAALVGGILFDSRDPQRAAQELISLLLRPGVRIDEIQEAGLDPELFDALRKSLPNEPAALASACVAGAAWVEGYRSSHRGPNTELVVGFPSDEPLPDGVVRTTGETLLAIFSQTENRLRLTAPFITPPGIEILGDALVALVARGATAEVISAPPSGAVAVMWQDLQERIRDSGQATGQLVLTPSRGDLGWPHLKVVTSDGTRAYVGSANFTRPGLTGGNLELGVLLAGEEVEAVDNVLDHLGEY